MRTALRLLIALNWTAAGFSCMWVVYGHYHYWHGQSYRWAHEQLDRTVPELKFGTEEHWRRSDILADEYKSSTQGVADLGWKGWCTAMVVGACTAVTLMIVFPKKTTPPPN